jgi:Flp pilus assembly CpaE family ATPase
LDFPLIRRKVYVRAMAGGKSVSESAYNAKAVAELNVLIAFVYQTKV